MDIDIDIEQYDFTKIDKFVAFGKFLHSYQQGTNSTEVYNNILEFMNRKTTRDAYRTIFGSYDLTDSVSKAKYDKIFGNDNGVDGIIQNSIDFYKKINISAPNYKGILALDNNIKMYSLEQLEDIPEYFILCFAVDKHATCATFKKYTTLPSAPPEFDISSGLSRPDSGTP